MNMSRHAFVGLLLAAALTASSCGVLGTEPLRGVEITTDDPAYAVGESIEVRIRNHSNRDAWFHHCNHRISLIVESRRGAGWEDVRGVDGPPCQAIHESGTMVLRPGESYSGTFTMDTAGTFRLRLLSGPESTAVGYNIVYSSTFDVGG
jgi:hypothetical protein